MIDKLQKRVGMHRNEYSWPKLKTKNEETKDENRNTEINYYANVPFRVAAVYGITGVEANTELFCIYIKNIYIQT